MTRPAVAALREALKTYGQHRVGCPHPSCPDCRTHTMAASKTPGYSYCTRCGRGSIPTSNEACDCGFEAALEAGAALEAPPPKNLTQQDWCDLLYAMPDGAMDEAGHPIDRDNLPDDAPEVLHFEAPMRRDYGKAVGVLARILGRGEAPPEPLKVRVSKEWCLEMALREGEHEVGAGGRHDYLIHEHIEGLVRCPLCAEQVQAALMRGEAGPALDVSATIDRGLAEGLLVKNDREWAGPGLDETALAAAERAYWKDDGVSRHNLGAAILTYLGAVRAGPLPPDPFVLVGMEGRDDDEAHEAMLVADLAAWLAENPREYPFSTTKLAEKLVRLGWHQSVRGVVPAPPPEPPPLDDLLDELERIQAGDYDLSVGSRAKSQVAIERWWLRAVPAPQKGPP